MDAIRLRLAHARRRSLAIWASTGVCFVAAVFVAVRVLHFGYILIARGDRDPSGIGLVQERHWLIMNLWPSPLKVRVAVRSCACVSDRIPEAPIRFLRGGEIAVEVNAINKGSDFVERVGLSLARSHVETPVVLEIAGHGFSGVLATPDAVIVPAGHSGQYVDNVMITFPASITLEELELKTSIAPPILRAAWDGSPRRINDTMAGVGLSIEATPPNAGEFDEWVVVALHRQVLCTVRVMRQ